MITPYYPDLSGYTNQKYIAPEVFKNIFNVGWLGSDHEFQTGKVDSIVLEKIRRLNVTIGGVSITLEGAIHDCPLCEKAVELPRENHPNLPLGIAEMWIPYDDKIYVSHDLIYHFILDHSYQPPQVFIEAIKAFDVESNWDSAKFFKKLRDENNK